MDIYIYIFIYNWSLLDSGYLFIYIYIFAFNLRHKTNNDRQIIQRFACIHHPQPLLFPVPSHKLPNFMYFRWTDKEEQVFQRDYSKDKNFRMYLIGISWDIYYLIVEELDRPTWIRWITKLRQKIKKEKDARWGKIRIMRKNLKGSGKNDSSSIFFLLSGEQEDYSSVFAIYRVSFHSLKRNIYRITRQNSRYIVFAFWSPNFSIV